MCLSRAARPSEWGRRAVVLPAVAQDFADLFEREVVGSATVLQALEHDRSVVELALRHIATLDELAGCAARSVIRLTVTGHPVQCTPAYGPSDAAPRKGSP